MLLSALLISTGLAAAPVDSSKLAPSHPVTTAIPDSTATRKASKPLRSAVVTSWSDSVAPQDFTPPMPVQRPSNAEADTCRRPGAQWSFHTCLQPGATSPHLSGSNVGLRDRDGWYQFQVGVGDSISEGQWVFGLAYRYSARHSQVDSIYRHDATFGLSPRIQKEIWLRGPGPTLFYGTIGVSYEWTSEDSSARDTGTLEYGALDRSTRISTSAWTGVLGLGVHIRTVSCFALSSGFEFGPQWKKSTLTGVGSGERGSEFEFHFLRPSWTLGADWFF